LLCDEWLVGLSFAGSRSGACFSLINVGLANYKQLNDHDGVGFALNCDCGGSFGISLSALPAIAEQWVTQDFLNPNYERINGEPVLFINDTSAVDHNSDPTLNWDDPNGVNQALQIIQDAAQKHGLPGVYIVGERPTAENETTGCVAYQCAWDGNLTQQDWNAISRFANPAVQNINGATPYEDMVKFEENVDWTAYEQSSAFHYIPSVEAGYDDRPFDEQYDDQNGNPALDWLVRTSSEVGQFLSDAITAANQHAQFQVEPPGSPPLILLDAWSEVSEGHYVEPTVGTGYTYEQAIATALGLPFQTTHARQFSSLKNSSKQVSGTLVVNDDWSPCVDGQTVLLQRKSNTGYTTAATATTQLRGSFTVNLLVTRVRGSSSIS